MNTLFRNISLWLFGKPPENTSKSEGLKSFPKPDWVAIEDDRKKWVSRYREMMKPRADGEYSPICLGEYPEETDEVWVEAHSGEPGVRHDDLTGWVVLSDLRNFFESNPWVFAFYREAIKQGACFPVGSSAIKFARRRKNARLNRSQSVVDLLNSEQEFTLSRLRVENGKWITQVKIGGRTTSGFDVESAVRGAFSYEK